MNKNECPSCAEKVNALIANTATAWTEEDRQVLEVMTEDQLDKLSVKPKAPVVNAAEPIKVTKEQAFAALGINDPKEFEAQMRFGLSIYNAERTRITDAIIANTKEGVWKKEDLDAMEFETLKKIASTVKADAPVFDFSAMGANPINTQRKQHTVPPMPIPGVTFKKV